MHFIQIGKKNESWLLTLGNDKFYTSLNIIFSHSASIRGTLTPAQTCDFPRAISGVEDILLTFIENVAFPDWGGNNEGLLHSHPLLKRAIFFNRWMADAFIQNDLQCIQDTV